MLKVLLKTVVPTNDVATVVWTTYLADLPLVVKNMHAIVEIVVVEKIVEVDHIEQIVNVAIAAATIA